MVFFASIDGTISKVSPANVYQWSNDTSEIILIAPWSGVSVSVSFKLPIGATTNELLMTPVYDNNPIEGFKTYRYALEQSITEYSGNITVQFFARNGAGQIVSSGSDTFRISNGVAPNDLPSVPDTDVYAAILRHLANYNGRIGALEGANVISSIALEGSVLSVVETTANEQPDGTHQRRFFVDLSSLSKGAVNNVTFDADNSSLEFDLKGNANPKKVDLSALKTGTIESATLVGDEFRIKLFGVDDPIVVNIGGAESAGAVKGFYSANNADEIVLDVKGNPERYTVSLSNLRKGALRGVRLDNGAVLRFTTDNGRGGSEDVYSVSLSSLVGGIEEAYYDANTKMLVFVYKTAGGSATVEIDLNDILEGIIVDLNDINIKNGDGEFSIVQRVGNDKYYPNNAVSPAGSTFGADSISGCLAFYIKSVDTANKKIYVSKTRPYDTYVPVFSTADNTEEGSDVPSEWRNQYLSIVSGDHYYPIFVPSSSGFTVEGISCASVYKNVITYSGTFPVSSFSQDTGFDGNTISTRLKPTYGAFPISYAAHSTGGACIASGNASDAGGAETVAHGDYSFARNLRCRASYGATAHGHGTAANGNFSFSAGEYTRADGGASAAFGGGSKTGKSAWAAMATGQSTQADGAGSHSSGVQTKALGRASNATGLITEASGEASTTEGTETKASAASAHAGGYKCEAKHIGAFVHGLNLVSTTTWQTVVGKGNDPATPSSDTFVVGNGVGGNAFTAGYNGAQGFIRVGGVTLTAAMLQNIIDTGLTWPVFDGSTTVV